MSLDFLAKGTSFDVFNLFLISADILVGYAAVVCDDVTQFDADTSVKMHSVIIAVSAAYLDADDEQLHS